MAKKVAHAKDQHDSHGVIHASTLTNESAIAMYLSALESRKDSDSHIMNSRVVLQRVADHIAPTPLLQAQFEELQSWQNSISRLAAGTIAVYIALIRSFYAWYIRPMRVLTLSPAADLAMPRVPKRRPRPIPEADYQWAVRSCADEQILVWLFLMRYAGLRCLEIALLPRDGVLDDADGSRLYIVGKGRKERYVPIGSELREALNPWMAVDGYLFTRENGKPYRASYVSRLTNGFLHGVGMPYTAHQLRHLFGTDALERSKDIRLVQELMGHSSVATTQLYTAVNSANGIALAAELGRDLRKLHRPK